MTGKLVQTPYDKLTYQIIGCAMATHRELGPGYREDTYQRDLEIRLAAAGVAFHPQKLLEVYDSESHATLIGYYMPDFVVADLVVVEIKAFSSTDNSHLAQVIGYLGATQCPIGLLINFGARSLQYRRVLPPRNLAEHRINRQWLFVPDWLKNT